MPTNSFRIPKKSKSLFSYFRIFRCSVWHCSKQAIWYTFWINKVSEINEYLKIANKIHTLLEFNVGCCRQGTMQTRADWRTNHGVLLCDVFHNSRVRLIPDSKVSTAGNSLPQCWIIPSTSRIARISPNENWNRCKARMGTFSISKH